MRPACKEITFIYDAGLDVIVCNHTRTNYDLSFIYVVVVVAPANTRVCK